MVHENAAIVEWASNVIKQDEIDRYLVDGKDFVDDALIERLLADQTEPDPALVREIANAATSGETLTPEQRTQMRAFGPGMGPGTGPGMGMSRMMMGPRMGFGPRW